MMKRREFLKAIGAGGLVVMAPTGLLPKARAEERFAQPGVAPRRSAPDPGNVVIVMMDADRNDVLSSEVPRSPDQWIIDDLMVTNKHPIQFPVWTKDERRKIPYFKICVDKKYLPFPVASDVNPVPLMEGDLEIPVTVAPKITLEFGPGQLRLDGTIFLDW